MLLQFQCLIKQSGDLFLPYCERLVNFFKKKKREKRRMVFFTVGGSGSVLYDVVLCGFRLNGLFAVSIDACIRA